MHEIIQGDCVAVMAAMDAASVDAVVTDPPYGLEFMGKEWDSLDAGLPQERVWKGRRGKGGSDIGTDDTRPGSRHRVGYGGKPQGFKRCSKCGKRQFSGTPCKCDEPEWVVEYAEQAPSSAIRMQRWHERWARAAYRVLKPGGHLLAFGGSRTYHRMVCAVEDAGFEIRDQIMWLFGSGFPKSLDVSKAIDKVAGAEREIVGRRTDRAGTPVTDFRGGRMHAGGGTAGVFDNSAITAPATDAARAWQGWGTALKPAHEPIVVARKPLIGTVTANVLKHGTGAINVDGCRIEASDGKSARAGHSGKQSPGHVFGPSPMHAEPDGKGRWPANVILDEDAGAMLDEQSGVSTHRRTGERQGGVWNGKGDSKIAAPGDSGGASRFFYCPKASREERDVGLKHLQTAQRDTGRKEGNPGGDNPRNRGVQKRHNHHPTVKPVALMCYLIRLVTPPSGTVLDPFLGSGTTLMAAALEGFDAIGIEREEEYVEIAKARIAEVERQIEILARQGTLDL